MPQLTPVQQFYVGKTLFITGASGFMGKVLMEKLLYSCSELKEIIIICRPKRGKSPEARLTEMWKTPIFQRIHDEKPHVLKKVTMFEGDITHDMLGLSDANLQHVIENTNIVFHVAASLDWEGKLSDSINMNIGGTKRTIDLARKMKNLAAFIHVSTAFCNVDQKIMREQVYDCHHKPEDIMSMAEWVDGKTVDAIAPSLLGFQPNNYVYTKRLTEIYVRDQYDTLPLVIVRPTVVAPAYEKPMPGWVEGLNGVPGITYAAVKGVLRSSLCDGSQKMDTIPVDMAINDMIIIARHFCELRTRPAEIPVYNLKMPNTATRSFDWIVNEGKKLTKIYPISWPLWNPNGLTTPNRYYHWFNAICFMWLPAILIDVLLTICGQKRFMIRVQKRVGLALRVLEFCGTNHWDFRDDEFMKISDSLTPEDFKIFEVQSEKMDYDVEEYTKNTWLGMRLHIAKEPLSTLPKARRILWVMRILDFVCQTLICSWFCYWLASKIGLVDFVRDLMGN